MIVQLVLASVLPFVDPFIGTKGTGHTFPGAAYPFDPCGGTYVRHEPLVRSKILVK